MERSVEVEKKAFLDSILGPVFLGPGWMTLLFNSCNLHIFWHAPVQNVERVSSPVSQKWEFEYSTSDRVNSYGKHSFKINTYFYLNVAVRLSIYIYITHRSPSEVLYDVQPSDRGCWSDDDNYIRGLAGDETNWISILSLCTCHNYDNYDAYSDTINRLHGDAHHEQHIR